MEKRLRDCQVEGCVNTNRNCKLSFFKFPPKGSIRFRKWFSNMEFKKSHKQVMVICSNHFDIRAFTNTLKTRLHSKAVPTIHAPGHYKHLRYPCLEGCSDSISLESSLPHVKLEIMDDEEHPESMTNGYVLPVRGTKERTIPIMPKVKVENEEIIIAEINIPAKDQNCVQDISNSFQQDILPSNINTCGVITQIADKEEKKNLPEISSPAELHLRADIKNIEKATIINVVEQNGLSSSQPELQCPAAESSGYRETEKMLKINQNKYFLSKIKKRILFKNPSYSTTSANKFVLSHLRANFKPNLFNVISSQLRNANKSALARRWTVQDKAFALDIYRSSPKAYKVLRKYLCLPTIKTLCKAKRKESTTCDVSTLPAVKCKVTKPSAPKSQFAILLNRLSFEHSRHNLQKTQLTS